MNRLVNSFLPLMPKRFVRHFAKPYIAGESLSDAISVVKQLMAQGRRATIDLLGEESTQIEHANEATQTYLEILAAIQRESLNANISLKPTHLGLKIDPELCYKNISLLAEEARRQKNFVRIDMEDSSCTDATVDLYQRLRATFDNVGTVLQAYHRHSLPHLNALLPLKPNLRICKGIYRESRSIAYQDKSIVSWNFGYLVEKMMANGCYVGIATHDEQVVWQALRAIDRCGLGPNQYEFQMLLGVDPQLGDLLVRSGHKLRIYVPFGKQWMAYSLRRLKENPEITGHILRNMFRRWRDRGKLKGKVPLSLPNPDHH